jgi:hypothetical protein
MTRTYVTDALPVGTSFLACCALALFTRIGYEAELGGEIQLLAEVVSIGETELRAGARTLAELGLFASKGRLRSVTPQPLAVYLASRGWEEFGSLVVERLLPRMTTDLAERLLQRAAEIGPSSAVLRAVDAILGKEDLFGSLSAITESGYLLDRTPFDRGAQPYQDAQALVNLRNELVHYKPQFRTGASEEPVEVAKWIKGLADKRFSVNPFTGDQNPFFPDRCLSHGCTVWAWNAALMFCDEFSTELESKLYMIARDKR